MAITTLPEGFASSGPAVLTQAPFITPGAIIWVDSVLGNDANAGTKRKAPKATVFGAAGAYSVATTGVGDMIVCEATHAESISSAFTWSKNSIRLVSYGSGTARATFTAAVAAGATVTVSGTNNKFDNLYWPAATAAITSKFSLTGAGNWVRANQFDAGSSDAIDQIIINAGNNALIESCTFTVTALPSGTTQSGITMTGTTTGCIFRDLTFDGGTFGWTEDAFVVENANCDQWDIQRLTLLNNSWLALTATGMKGNISGLTQDLASGVRWLE